MFLIVLVCVLIWIALGFAAFMMEAHECNYKEFECDVISEFFLCLAFAPIVFLIFLLIRFCKWFKEFMNEQLYKMNGD